MPMPRNLGRDLIPPIHRLYDPDDSMDFHAARLLVLLSRCGGDKQSVEGRTKLAKLDFFVRYPQFLEIAETELARRGEPNSPFTANGPETEAPMIRYRFGPWDPRYRNYLTFLRARGLVKVTGSKVERVTLTAKGRTTAATLASTGAFSEIVRRCDAMAGNLSEWNGTRLMELVYELFPRQVGAASYRSQIQA